MLGHPPAHPLASTTRGGASPTGHVVVFAPSPILTVTIEAGHDQPEVHLHAGGQGFWVARMAAHLGATVTVCCALGGESGHVLRTLMTDERLVLAAVTAPTPNGVYIHDRRSGDRVEVVSTKAPPLSRHESDELYGLALAAGLDGDVTLVTGTQPDRLLDADVYRRLSRDLRQNQKPVIADLTGPPLDAVLAGGIDVLKLNAEKLVRDRRVQSDDFDTICRVARRFHAAGAARVVISRADHPALLVEDGGHPQLVELTGPTFEPLDPRGAGDSMFAGIGVGLARGMSVREAVRLGMAAGALNVTRHGLGTGTRSEIERMAEHVVVSPILATLTGA